MGIDPDPQNFWKRFGVALQFLYSLLEQKAGLQETEFRLGFRTVHPLHLPASGDPRSKDGTIVQT